MKPKHWVGTLLAILLLIPWAALAAPVGKITNMAGNVDITITGKAARNVNLGDPVNVGDFVRTKSKSKVEITFNEGNILRMAENTRVGITQYMSGEKQNSSIFNLFRGKIQNIVKSVGIGGGRYEVHTPSSVCGVRGTHFYNFYLAGASGSIFQEGSGYGYSKNNPDDIKSIAAGQGMFVSSTAMGAQLRSVSNKQLDEMKNATEILGSSGSSGDIGDLAGAGGDPPTPPSNPPVKPPVIPPVQYSTTLDLTITPASNFTHKIDEGGIISGTTSDSGTTFSLTAAGAMTGTADNPGAGLINGTIKTGATITSGVSGYMMGLPNLSRTGAKALLSAIYVNNDGQAGFLVAPMTATFTSNAFSGTGLAYKYPTIASTSLTPTTLAPSIMAENGVPSIGNVILTPDSSINLTCSANSCESEARVINVNGGGKIGVWGAYSTGGSYSNIGGITSFTNKRYVSYNSNNKTSLYSENLSGAVDTAAKEVSISGDFLLLNTRYKGTATMNHFGYYDNSNSYTSISSGTLQLVPLAFANELSSSLSGISGIMGSTSSLWTNTSVPVTMIGKYPSDFSGYKVIAGGWESYNYRLGSGTLTNDGGGTYKGYLNTHLLLSSTNTISTDALALYADNSGHIGILRGSASGLIYSAEGGFKAEGTLNRIEMADTFAGNTSSSFALETTGNREYENLLTGGPLLKLNGMSSEWLNGGSYWGIGKTVSSGTYTLNPLGDAVFNYYRSDTKGSESFVYTQTAASWTDTTKGGYFRGNFAGAAADWQSATTSVFGGTVMGTFNAAAASTWNATTLSTRIETAKFIDMAATETGRTKLADLNIPSVIVGSVNMSKSSGDHWTSLNINDMGFYASTSGAKPQIWASNNVNGSFSSAPDLADSAVLKGTSGGTVFTANFVVRKWNTGTGKWTADITAGTISPALNTATKFQGGAAGNGAAAGSGIISGTASGTAYK